MKDDKRADFIRQIEALRDQDGIGVKITPHALISLEELDQIQWERDVLGRVMLGLMDRLYRVSAILILATLVLGVGGGHAGIPDSPWAVGFGWGAIAAIIVVMMYVSRSLPDRPAKVADDETTEVHRL